MNSEVKFDVCDFLYSDNVREITISIEGKVIKICEERFGVTSVWIVPGLELERVLKDRFRSFYPMFFGILLETLHRENAKPPINEVRFNDLDLAFEKNDLQSLADCLAAGAYQPSARPS
ncbi:hypothetical protein J2W35_001369 [Variovorax boronicumulans]|uniref:hypothetical protein n=1 Tax=Variovorax boronicumulans TaxID=436515 RepID=UPI00277E8831|nr:hypothetical protein [Variovorax boronicumulans]MDQ0081032.1 hypothetical protein [Variovorax boronicumulans]